MIRAWGRVFCGETWVKMSTFRFLTHKVYFPIIWTPKISKNIPAMEKYTSLSQNSTKVLERNKALGIYKYEWVYLHGWSWKTKMVIDTMLVLFYWSLLWNWDIFQKIGDNRIKGIWFGNRPLLQSLFTFLFFIVFWRQQKNNSI